MTSVSSIYRLKYTKKGKSSKESTHQHVQGIDLKSIQGTLTLPEKMLLDKVKKCAHMFPNLYSKDSTLAESLRELEDEIPVSFDFDHPLPSQSKLHRHHSS